MKTLLAFALLALASVRSATVHINNAQEFIQFANNVNSGSYKAATVFLDNDIDFTGVSNQFRAIGTGFSYTFSGVFDGQGHTISHLTIQNKVNANSLHFGIFTHSTGTVIRNLIVDNTCSVTGASYTTSVPGDPLFMDVGGIIGHCEPYNNDCLIENNVFMGKLGYIGDTPTDYYVVLGGIVGEIGSYGPTGTVRNCVNYGTISFTGAADSTILGGIVGLNAAEMGLATYVTKIYNCLNYGIIMHSGTSRYRLKIGGVIGSIGNGIVEVDNIVNMGPISVNNGGFYREDNIGTLVGLFYNTKMTNSYWVTDSKYDVVGKNYESSSLTQCSNFTSATFTLMESVKVGSYSGKSLIQALNAGADAHSSEKYSKWVLNKNNKAVSFAVNGEAPFFKMSAQLILTPGLADGVSKKFDGWYTDSACTTKLTNFEVNADLNLYGRFA